MLKLYKDATLSLLAGFILGSLTIIWPWKEVERSIIINGEEKILEYNWYFPNLSDENILVAVALIIFGIIVVWALESFSSKKTI